MRAILVTTLLAATSLVSALEVVDTFFISPQTYKISVNAKGDILLGREASNRLFLTKLGVEGDILWERRIDDIMEAIPVGGGFRFFGGDFLLRDSGDALVALGSTLVDNMVKLTSEGQSDAQWGSAGATFFAGKREGNSFGGAPSDAQFLGYLSDGSFLTWERTGPSRGSRWGYIIKYASNGGRDNSFRPFRNYFDSVDVAYLNFSKGLPSGKIVFKSTVGDIYLCDQFGNPVTTFGEDGVVTAQALGTSLPHFGEVVDVIELTDGTLRFAEAADGGLALYDISPSGDFDRLRLSRRVKLIDLGGNAQELHFFGYGNLAVRTQSEVSFINQLGEVTSSVQTVSAGLGGNRRLRSSDDYLFLLELDKIQKFAFPPDSDGDKLSDVLEIELGTSQDDLDSDGDGIDDWTEFLGLGLDPKDPDSDGDGYSDGVEYTNGFDPKDPESKPSTLIEIKPAVEISVFGEVGKRYRLEYSEDLKSWSDSGITFEGTNARFDHLESTRSSNHKHWRVVEIP